MRAWQPSAGVHLVLAMVVAPLASTVCADEVVWQQDFDLQDYWGPSQKSPAAPGQLNKELADDFDIYGSISRVDVAGVNSFFGAGSAPFVGLYVRFYALGDDHRPGTLQVEYYLPKASPNLWMDFPDFPMSFHATLSPPFAANGRHFVAVQALMDVRDGSYWEWDSADTGNPHGEAFYFRDLNATDPSWGHLANGNSDLTLVLWGSAQPAPPSLYSLSSGTLVRSGRVKINGARFGAQQGAGVVLIGNVPAPVTRWSEWQITAYVPETAPVGAVSIQVINDAGASNELPLAVTLRPPPDGHMKWRFMADSYYIQYRPAIGSDGTIYTVDSGGVLYALQPDGGLKWVFRFDQLTYGTVAIGADDTIYVAGLFSTITAVNPDGTLKWQFTEDPAGQGVFAGPAVGPDGNIYVVTDYGGLGAFALSPQGQLLWNIPSFDMYGGGSEEIVFGPPDQFYFIEVHQGSPAMLNAVGLDGAMSWPYNLHLANFMTQAAVGPDGTVYVRWYSASTSKHLEAVNPDGTFKWALFDNNMVNSISTPDVGPDGMIYLVGNLSFLEVIRPNGTVKTTYFENVVFGGPVLNPQNTLLLVGGVEGTGRGQPTFIKTFDTNAQPLWRVDLPYENGAYLAVMARPRFTPDGRTAYVGTTGNNYAEDIYCYLYAIAVVEPLVGDLNCDDMVDFGDINPFVLALTDPVAYASAYPNCDLLNADINADGSVDFGDINAFVALLSGG